MKDILEKKRKAEAELENLNKEIEEKKKLLQDKNVDKNKGDDLLCQEAYELYDILDWVFMANNDGEWIVESNNFFSKTIIKGMNDIYDRGYQNAIDELRGK